MQAPKNLNLNTSPIISARIAELFQEQEQSVTRYTDHLFTWVMILQWLFGIALALTLSPQTWQGSHSQINIHVWLAIFFGGAISALPVYLTRVQPGKILTRHVVAVGQMLMSELLIDLTGGRIETHFHVFGSLALLAFYRDWRVLVSATVVVAGAHLLQGTLWPETIYGVAYAPLWRTLEHAGWVLFEVIFLIIAIRKSVSEMHLVAERQAKLEALNESIEHTVAERTAELTHENMEHRKLQVLYHSLVEQMPAGIFRKDIAGRYELVNAWFCDLCGINPKDILGKTADEVASSEAKGNEVHSMNRGADHHKEIMQVGKIIEAVEEHVDAHGKLRQVRAIKTPVLGMDGSAIGSQGILMDITAIKEAEDKLHAAHQQLMDASRQAGMAEVATSVLHNVGNVLNSVNVSSSLITDKVRNSKTGNLVKAAALMRAHESDLGNFFANDTKGKQLPEYLAKLADHLAKEQEEILKELNSLVNNIIHIKEIVAMQQGYAKASGILEPHKAADLVEDALRMNIGAVNRHNITVVREFKDVPPIMTDKHKVLQILVNLIRNAKYACDDSGKTEKEIKLRVWNGDGRVKIAVSDNGIGIPEENLTRIFNHGFTTRKEGHGFGLHSGAIAASELKGKLTASSDGIGRGASFVLELPVNQPQDDS